MQKIYITMVGVCGVIAFMSSDDFVGFTGWLSAALAYGLAAMERS